MTRRTIVGAALALVAAAAIPLGLPHSVSASGYNTLVISPLPIAQPGALAASQVVDLCVQPEQVVGSTATHVSGIVWLAMDSGLFTSPSKPGGTATVGVTPLTTTPQSFDTANFPSTCSFTGGTATTKFAIPVVYTAAAIPPANGRDVIVAGDASTDFTGGPTNVECTSGVCDSGTYVYSPVTAYVFNQSPIAATGTLTAGQVDNTLTVTANDSTGNPVPGAYLDLSLTSTGSSGGTAEAFNEISNPPSFRHLTNSAQRVGATNAGTVAITYTAANPLPASGIDTITAQNHPTETVENSTSYTYATSTAPPSNPYTAVPPFRVCDTRPAQPGIAANQCNTGAGSGPIASGATRVIAVGGLSGDGVPASGVTAVVVNLTGIAPSASTFLTLYPDGTTKPRTSNLNPLKGGTVANLVEVGVSSAGKLDLFNTTNTGSINVALDVEGYVSATSPGFYNAAAAPVRICDTRHSGPGISANQCNTLGTSPIAGGATLTFKVNPPAPGSAVTAVVFNLTGIGPTKNTVLTAFTGSRPTASNLNINGGTATALSNRVIVPVTCAGGNCTVSIWNSVGSINIAVDIDGWFTATGTSFTAMPSPARVCDTRFGNVNDQGCAKALVAAGAARMLNITITNIDGIPSNATAIVANVTAVNATTGTFITVFPGPSTQGVPTASDINDASSGAVPSLVVVGVGSDGTINLFNDVGSVNLIVDVLGYYS